MMKILDSPAIVMAQWADYGNYPTLELEPYNKIKKTLIFSPLRLKLEHCPLPQ